jgi:hypothetical protein
VKPAVDVAEPVMFNAPDTLVNEPLSIQNPVLLLPGVRTYCKYNILWTI